MEFGEPKIGQTFSHYRLVSKLGEGGMGIVYAAEDLSLGREVAVKFLLTGRHKRLSRARFQREARSTSALSHPNIATVYDYGETDEGFPFIVMELLRGQTLSELLRQGSLTLERSVEIICSVLEALCEAHRHGIVHRDIKPLNIVITERGQVKVLDFGLAKSLWGENGNESDSKPNQLDADALAALPTQTLTGMVLGTPLYVSPEQATGIEVDQRSDLFSVGAVLYEALAGRPAFAAPSVVEIFANVINSEPPPPPSKFNPNGPPWLDRVTLKALARKVEDRYQTAEEFLADLCRVRSELSEVDGMPREVLGDSLDSLYEKIVSRANKLRDSFSGRKLLGTRSGRMMPSRLHPLAWAVLPLVVALTVLLVGLLTNGQDAAPINSIAVIPFVNEGGDANAEYLSDGFTDSLISSLSQVSDLRVISHSSVARYKGQEIDPAAVGADLNVRAVLIGRVSKTGDDLRLMVELIDTRDRSRLWGERYDRKATEMFPIQTDIVSSIIQKMRQRLSAEGEGMLTKRLSNSPAAYDLYLKGRWYWSKLTQEGAKQAIKYYQQAIDLDPNFALAYAGLADTYMLNSWVPPGESYRRAKAAAEKALELDETLAEAHTTIAFIKTHYEKDWDGAEAEFKRAIALKPGYATAHHWYSDHLIARGQFDRALKELNLAKELDPLSPIINMDIGAYYFYTRQYDRAVEELKKVSELFPDFYSTHFHLAMAYTQKGMYDHAISEYEKALSLSKRHSLILATLSYTYAVSGREDEARQILGELEAMSREKNVSPYRFALVYTGLGDKDAAFRWLNRACDENDIMSIYVNVSPFSDTLKQDSRFTEILRRMNLAPQ